MGHEKNARGRYGELYIPSLTSLFLHLYHHRAGSCAFHGPHFIPGKSTLSHDHDTDFLVTPTCTHCGVMDFRPTDPPAIARTMTYETLLGDRSP